MALLISLSLNFIRLLRVVLSSQQRRYWVLEFALITWASIVLYYACVYPASVNKAKDCFLFLEHHPQNFLLHSFSLGLMLAIDVRDLIITASLDQDTTPTWRWHHFPGVHTMWITKITSTAALVEWVLIFNCWWSLKLVWSVWTTKRSWACLCKQDARVHVFVCLVGCGQHSFKVCGINLLTIRDLRHSPPIMYCVPRWPPLN